MFDINGWELVIIAVLAMLLIGPERLPHYAGKLRGWIRELRSLAEGAREQLREQMGPDFDDVDWKAYDPRQYDPRRIVREALLEDGQPGGQVGGPTRTGAGGPDGGTADESMAPRPPAGYDPHRPTPYDSEAT